MRIEAAPFIYRSQDRRTRTWERRAVDERRNGERNERRARHAATLWNSSSFGAHLLGQIAPERATPAHAARAYSQPESRMTPRPHLSRSA